MAAYIHKFVELSQIVLNLTKPDRQRLERVLNLIIEKNAHFTGQFSFRYSGAIYGNKKARQICTLDESLYDEMDSFLEDQNNITNDIKVIDQLLYIMTQHCVNQQQIRNCLPDAIAKLSPLLAGIERTMDMDSALPMSVKPHVDKHMPMVMSYLVSQLLY